ncbi:MAG: DUF445 domain-containing protein [Clostridia bacterium]|nr:DUF445 domain-containing protein [Clostridia bacterium]
MNDNTNYEINTVKLRKMRHIATGLLVLMALIYIVFKKFETNSLFFSAIVAFSEAAMIGALADWFAVVALFRHPLGLKWIPHTAIIPNNKDRIGESLSSFVVSNFFTDEIIKRKLNEITPSEEIIAYLSKNRDTLSESLISKFPHIIQSVFDNPQLMRLINDGLKDKLRSVKLYPLIGSTLQVLVSSGQHMPIVKELLISLHTYISENKDGTLKFLEGLNKTLAMPVIGDIVYKNILKILSKQIESIENNARSDINKLLLYSLPKLITKLKTSEDLIEKGEEFKKDMLDSDLFNSYIGSIELDIKEILTHYSQNSGDSLRNSANKIIDIFINEVLATDPAKEKIDSFIRDSITSIICRYREDIGRLICDTIKDWEKEDVANKLEAQVGSDLQYIRINGTVIGGLAGLAIHLISYVIK